MRITVDIDEATLKEAMALTGERNKSPAVAKVVVEYVRRAKAREFGRLIREGAFDYGEPTGARTLREDPAGDPLNPIPPLYSSES
jgi:hypothetical protein